MKDVLVVVSLFAILALVGIIDTKVANHDK